MLRRSTPMLILALVTVVSVAMLGAVAPAQSGPERRCGTIIPSGPKNIRAQGLSCRAAKRVALRHLDSVGDNSSCGLEHASCRVVGFSCRQLAYSPAGARILCTRGAAQVRFFYGI